MNRVCPKCSQKDPVIPGSSPWPLDWECPTCHTKNIIQDGFPLLCPTLADTETGFDPEGFSALYANEENHFWFKARNELISWLVHKYFPNMKSYLEVGCGTGFVMARIAKEFKSANLSATEIHPKGMAFARKRLGNSVNFFQSDARELNLEECFEVIGSFDVLEHIKEDTIVLENFHKALVAGGGVVLTVPQHPFLWGPADEIAHHERRYKRGELEEKLQNAGFEIQFSSSYLSLLLPVMIASRFVASRNETTKSKQQKHTVDSEFNIPSWLNALFYQICKVEFILTKAGIRWPSGGSRVIVAVKKG